MWAEVRELDPPFTGPRVLAEMKKTGREKDYPFIGELARRMSEPRDRLLDSRSAADLLALAARHPDLVAELEAERPLLGRIPAGRRALAEAIQLEMLDLVEADERRLAAYRAAAAPWAAHWAGLARELDALPLLEAHERMVAEAGLLLPETPRR